jgi:hypothetical protein
MITRRSRRPGPTAAIRSALAALLWAARKCDCDHLPLAERIAVVLCRAGCRVVPPDCPVAAWARRQTGLAVMVAGPIPAHRGRPWSPGAVFIPAPGPDGTRPGCRVPLPAAVGLFVTAFDQFRHLELMD